MRKLLLFCIFATSVGARTPRIWLDDALLAKLRAKAAANTADWRKFVDLADTYKSAAGVSAFPKCDGLKFICWNGGVRGGYQGSSWYEAAVYLGGAYQITGDTAYAGRLAEVLDAIGNSWDGRSDCRTYDRGVIPMSINLGWPARNVMPALGIGYDWIYDRLSADQKSRYAATANCFYQWAGTLANDWPPAGGPTSSNYFGGYLLGFGLAGIAMDGDDPAMTAMQTTVRAWWDGRNFPNSVANSFTKGAYQGGYNPESYTNYGANHIDRLLQYALAVKTYTGETIWKDYPNRLFRAELYNLMPGRWRTSGEADWIGPGVGNASGSNFNLYAYVLDGTPDGEYAQYVWNNLGVSPDGTNLKTFGDVYDGFFFQHDRKASDYRSAIPPYAASYANSDGHVYVRTDWSDAAVWASYVGGIGYYTSSHQISIAGNVSINRAGDYLLPFIGNWAGLNGVAGSPSIYDSPAAANFRANTLYFYDYPLPDNVYGQLADATQGGATSAGLKNAGYLTAGTMVWIGFGTPRQESAVVAQSMGGGKNITFSAPLQYDHIENEHITTGWGPNYLNAVNTNFGGQTGYPKRGSLPPWDVPDLAEVKQTPQYTFAHSNLTGAYDQTATRINAAARTMRSYYRTFVWMGDGYFVVRDRAQSKPARAGVATYDKLLFWHLPPNTSPQPWTDPEMQGTRVTSAPVGSSRLVIDTLQPARASITLARDSADSIYGNSGGLPIAPITADRMDAAVFANPAKPLTYRIEVRDSNPRDTFEALTVLMALEADQQPPATAMISSLPDTHVGVLIADDSPRIVILPADDTQHYAAVSFAQDFSGVGRILIAGLEPNSSYIVTRDHDPVSASPITAGPDGTVYFESTGGGRFVIEGLHPTVRQKKLASIQPGWETVAAAVLLGAFFVRRWHRV
jgi:hypothetical protein